jgi:UrcA family protein
MRHALLALIAAMTTAQASAPQVLRFSGADLGSPQAVAHTYHRLQTGAELACNGYQGRDLARQRVFRECVAQTVDNTVARIHSAPLTAYHAAQRGETLRTAAGSLVSAATTRQKE